MTNFVSGKGWRKSFIHCLDVISRKSKSQNEGVKTLCCLQLYPILQSLCTDNRFCSTFFCNISPSLLAQNLLLRIPNNLWIITKNLLSLFLLLTVDLSEHHRILKNIGNKTQNSSLGTYFQSDSKIWFSKETKQIWLCCTYVCPDRSLWLLLTKVDKEAKFNKYIRDHTISVEMVSLVAKTDKN